MRLTFASAEANLIFLLYMKTKEPKTVLLKAVRVKEGINPFENAREFRKIMRNSLEQREDLIT